MNAAQMMAVRLYDQAREDQDKAEALLEAAAMLAADLGHTHTATRFREVVLRTQRRQRRTLNTRRPKD